jgi:hypothetical protein
MFRDQISPALKHRATVAAMQLREIADRLFDVELAALELAIVPFKENAPANTVGTAVVSAARTLREAVEKARDFEDGHA